MKNKIIFKIEVRNHYQTPELWKISSYIVTQHPVHPGVMEEHVEKCILLRLLQKERV